MKKVEEIYACVFEDHSVGEEGLMSTMIPSILGNQLMVLVSCNKRNLEGFKSICKLSSQQEGKKIRILKFTNIEEVEVIDERN